MRLSILNTFVNMNVTFNPKLNKAHFEVIYMLVVILFYLYFVTIF